MEERDKLYRQRAQERARRKQSQSSLGCQRDKGNETLRTKSRTTFARAPVVVPRTTTNFQMKTAAIYARREKEVDDLERKKQLEKARRVQEQVTSKRLAQAMAQMDRQQGRMPRRDTVEEAHQNARESRERYRKALKENRKKLEQVRAFVLVLVARSCALFLCVCDLPCAGLPCLSLTTVSGTSSVNFLHVLTQQQQIKTRTGSCLSRA